jgi:poly-gamma-glutamate synthesis protein (capsule biosynthesis protein)
MPTFQATITPLDAALRARMQGRSWRPEARCPPFEALRLVRAPHVGFDGQVHEGELIVAAAVAEDVARALGRIFANGFPIERMRLVDAYDGDDYASMAANNSSGFNYRVVHGTDDLSRHALGLAIDINPLQNPYVVGDEIFPPGARAYLDRGDLRPGMIVRPGPVVEAFEAIGWEWGGDWSGCKDYQHFTLRRG